MVDGVLTLLVHDIVLKSQFCIVLLEDVRLKTKLLLYLLFKRLLVELEVKTLLEAEVLLVLLGHHGFDQ